MILIVSAGHLSMNMIQRQESTDKQNAVLIAKVFIFFQNSFPFNQLHQLKRWLLPRFSCPDYWLLFCCLERKHHKILNLFLQHKTD